MPTINTIAFMAGYMEKEAVEPKPFDTGYQPQIAGNIAAAQRTLTPEQMESIGSQGVQQMGADVNSQFLSSQGNRDMATIGGGAAIGGALGGLMGGDATSVLMGTALGGLVGWLGKHFFGGDINNAYDAFQRWMNQGTAETMVKKLGASNPSAQAEFDANKLDVKESTAQVAEAAGGKAIDAVNAKSTPEQNAEAAAALDLKAKNQAAAAKKTIDEGNVAPDAVAGAQPAAVPPAQPAAQPGAVNRLDVPRPTDLTPTENATLDAPAMGRVPAGKPPVSK